MKSLHSIADLASLPGPLHLAAGFFDGVHLGHQEVLRSARHAADASGGSAAVLTFDRHPATIIRPAAAPRLLTSTRHRTLIMERLGAAAVLVLPFNESLAALPPEDFIGQIVRSARPLGSISAGTDWAFGHARAGNMSSLAAMGKAAGFSVHAVPPVIIDGEPVSSTRVRLAVEAGDFTTAASLLGRSYSILGDVILGRQLGRKLGFPTANLALESEQFPPSGVYAVHVVLDSKILPGVANLGFRPTVDLTASTRHFEVHLLDFSGDLYGRTLDVRFITRIRDEVRFDSLDALKSQIHLDAHRARSILAAL